jgi:hypothetical protein
MENQEYGSDQAEYDCNSPGIIDGPCIISYNLREDERPDGIKVRFKIRIETGRKAAVTEARQADALRELLLWARQHRTQTQQPPEQ